MSKKDEGKPTGSGNALIDSILEKLKDKYDRSWWDEDLRPEEIAYLVDHCPYLQMVDGDNKVEFQAVQLKTAKTGWTLHDFVGAISSSPGLVLFREQMTLGAWQAKSDLPQASEEEGDDGGSGEGDFIPGPGSIWHQAFQTCFEMVAMAKEYGWGSVYLYQGHPYMIRSAWIAATYEFGLATLGFEPSDYDMKVRERFMQSNDDFKSYLTELRREHRL